MPIGRKSCDLKELSKHMIAKAIEWRSPLDCYRAFRGIPHAHLLHAGAASQAERWSTLVANPVELFEVRGDKSYLNGEVVDGDCLTRFQALLNERSGPLCDGVPNAPFLCGAVGFVGYEFGSLLEPSVLSHPSPFALPDMMFGFYNGAIVFDNLEKQAFICGLDSDIVDQLESALASPPSTPSIFQTLDHPQSNFQKEEYVAAIHDVIEYILDGGIFQANIAQQLRMHIKTSDIFGIFEAVIRQSAAPFGAYLNYDDVALMSNSPERFFKLVPEADSMHIITEPIKGTAPRGKIREEDERFAAALISDEKERAENIMIADLNRNDLSRICLDETIREDEICALHSYATVHHMVSKISGQLRRGVDFADVLKAMFPCGSITGAPKIEAMNTIARTEELGRGPYTGTIGYIDDRGGSDFSICIRTMIAEKMEDDWRLTLPVGGGITALSDPEREYEETLLKAEAFLSALDSKVT